MPTPSIKKKSDRNVLNIIDGRNLKVVIKDLWKSSWNLCNKVLVNGLIPSWKTPRIVRY